MIALLGFLTACGADNKAEQAEKEAAELRREIETLRQEKAEREAREAALKDQLENEAAERAELIEELERVKPTLDRSGEAERDDLEEGE